MTTFVNTCQAGNGTNLTRQPFLRYLSTTGDGAIANSSIIGNYSGAVTDFYYQIPAERLYKVGTIILTISSASQMRQDGYGDIVAGLTNGIKFYQKVNGVETQLFGGLTMKKNYEVLSTTSNVTLSTFFGNAQTLTITVQTFAELGSYIDLNGNNGDRFIIRVNDSFTTLVDQRCVIRGIQEVL